MVRNYLHLAGSGARINRLITIGTPHQGAPIAANLLNGRVVAYFGGMAFTIGQALQFFADNDPAWYTYPIMGASVESAARAMQQLGQLLQDNNVFAGIGIGAALPVTTQDVPNSAFITQNVNSPANIALEGGLLSARIGVATQLDPNGAILHILTSDPSTARRVRAIAMAAALNLYLYYSEHPDWWLASHADYWLDMYWYLRQMDVAWADFTGVMLGWQGPWAVVARSDGFIPQASAAYPNGTDQRILQLPNFNIPHTRQTDHPAVRERLATELINTFQIPARPSAPPPELPPPSDCQPVGSQIVCNP